MLSLASLFTFMVAMAIATPAEKPVIGSSSKDGLFAAEMPPIVCSDPIKTTGCSGLCTDMKLDYDEIKHVNGRDADPKHGISKPERYDVTGLEQRKIMIPVDRPNDITEIKKQAPGVLYTWDSADEDKEQDGESPSNLTTYEVGHPGSPNCKWATIWIHGATPVRGGLGMADNLFGGAFNRMKRLAQDNNGVYYSPTIQDFSDDSGVEALIKHIRQKSCPNGKIVVNCGSAGTTTCWKLASNPRVFHEISGLVLIGSTGGPGEDFLNSEAGKMRIPVLFAQGEHDSPDYWQKLVAKIHKQDPKYPIRYLVYKDGGHMTPLRMLDWKATMNCMLSQASDVRGPASPPVVEKSPSVVQ